ncbi:hypothetical protein ABW20_dc0109016 [Dactylellina cionopaga]|nr:hypothetical protein ABW20_dc0109016 [Dactylellina cionopaga]
MSTPETVPVTVLPLIPLPSGHVLLPGILKRIHVNDRPDIVALLRDVFGKSTDEFLSNSHNLIGCVPLKAPVQVQFLRDSADRKHLDGDPDSPLERESFGVEDIAERIIKAVIAPDPKVVGPADLFTHGVSAKVVGLEERTTGGMTILVEGIVVFKVTKVVQDKPYIRAEVEMSPVEDSAVDPIGQKNFLQLKSLSKELVVLLRMSALSLRNGSGLTPSLARRIDQFVSSKDPSEAAGLAHFLVSAIDASYTDQLAMLTAPNVNAKLEKSVDILTKHVNVSPLDKYRYPYN